MDDSTKIVEKLLRETGGGAVTGNQSLLNQRANMILQRALADVKKRHPVIGRHKFAASYGPQSANIAGGGLEFYDPREPKNPTPGRPHIQIFDRGLQGGALESAIKGDALHYLPSVDPRWEEMRQQFSKTITPQQDAMNKRAYESAKSSYGETGSYEDWMNRSRLDAFIRGKLTPDQNDEWKNIYTPEQELLLEKMKGYVFGGNGALPTPAVIQKRGGNSDSAIPNRQTLRDDGMGMSMGDPRRATTPTRIQNAYRGPLSGTGALSDAPRPGSGEWEI